MSGEDANRGSGFYDFVRGGVDRLGEKGWPVLQTAVAVGLAWYLASVIFGHEQPLFASIAALISLGVSVGRQWKRAIQVILGVGSGIALAGVLVSIVGSGPLQMVLVVGLALAAAVFLGAEPLLMTQVGISAITAVGVEAPTGGLFSPERLLDALVGAGVAVVINVIFPVDPERRVERSARPILDELAAVLNETAGALENVDFERAESALVRARKIDDQVDELRQSLEAARDTARLSPARHQSLGRLGYYELATDHLDLIVPGARVLARAALRLLRSGEPAPKQLSGAVENLSRAVGALAEYLEEAGRPAEETRRLALGAAGDATALLEERNDLAIAALVAQIRSTAVDILRGTGMDYQEALAAVEETVAGSPQEPADAPGRSHPSQEHQ
ncbi:MAG: FUSC family protein [Actinomycetota bacterium]|nr:FUSC family protein [Actinomycetota bacterium]